jgi:hypothetical protein
VEEDDIPLPQEPISIECELERFRLQWHQELVDRKTTGGTGGARGKKEENGNVVAAEENGNAKAEEPSIEEQVCRDGGSGHSIVRLNFQRVGRSWSIRMDYFSFWKYCVIKIF